MLPSSMWSRLSPGLQEIVIGGGVYSADFAHRRRTSLSSSSGAWADQSDELVDALGGLLDGPVVAHAGDQGSHLCVGPDEREVVPIEGSKNARDWLTWSQRPDRLL